MNQQPNASEAQAELARKEAEKLVDTLKGSDEDKVFSYAAARKACQEIERYLEAADAAVSQEDVEKSAKKAEERAAKASHEAKREAFEKADKIRGEKPPPSRGAGGRY